jgi:hypothetical protein
MLSDFMQEKKKQNKKNLGRSGTNERNAMSLL